jgi:hypothetical protein
MSQQDQRSSAWADPRVRKIVYRRFRLAWTQLIGTSLLICCLVPVFFIGARHDIGVLIAIGFLGPALVAYLFIPSSVLLVARRHLTINVLKRQPLEMRRLLVRMIPETSTRAERLGQPFLPKVWWGVRAALTIEGDELGRTYRVRMLGRRPRLTKPPILEERVLLNPGIAEARRMDAVFLDAALVALDGSGRVVLISERFDSGLFGSAFTPPLATMPRTGTVS